MALPAAEIPRTHVSILEKAQLAIVSTIRHKDGYISTNPMGFYWDGEHIWFSTFKERVKYPNLVQNPQMTVCIIDPEEGTRYIEIRGSVELADDSDKRMLHQIFNKGREEKAEFDLDAPGVHRVSVKLIPHQVSTPLLYGGKMAKDQA